MTGRLHRWLVGLLVALALAGCAAVLTQSRTSRQAADFTIYYGAAVLVREGHPAAPYDQAALSAAISRAAPESDVDRRLPFNLPVAAILPLVPLTLLPLDLAFRAWQLLSIALLMLALLVFARAYPLGRSALKFAALGCLASVPAWSILTEAQLTPLLLLGSALVLAALRWNGASLAFGGGLLLAVKPHFLPAYLVVLLAARHWRSLLGAIAGAVMMLLSPLAAGGPAAMGAMVQNALSTNGLVPVRLTEALVGLLSAVLPVAAVPLVSLALYAGALVLLSLLGFRLSPAAAVPFAALALTIGVLVSPHVLPHDLLLLAAPGWLAFWLYRQGRIVWPLPFLMLIDLALLVDLRGVGIVLGPIVITGVVALAFASFKRRAARRPVLSPAAAA